MSSVNAIPVPVVDPALPAAPRRRSRAIRGSRPGWVVYTALGAVLLASVFPFYWSLLIGSGDSSTIRDVDRRGLVVLAGDGLHRGRRPVLTRANGCQGLLLRPLASVARPLLA